MYKNNKKQSHIVASIFTLIIILLSGIFSYASAAVYVSDEMYLHLETQREQRTEQTDAQEQGDSEESKETAEEKTPAEKETETAPVFSENHLLLVILSDVALVLLCCILLKRARMRLTKFVVTMTCISCYISLLIDVGVYMEHF